MTAAPTKEPVPAIPEELVRRAFTWLFGRDTGSSSKAILGHMLCGVSDGSWPSDPSDLGRCLRLLELFPEWKERIGEMSRYGKVWAVYAERWGDLASVMTDEVGTGWSKGRAEKTYDLMQTLRKQSGGL